VPLGIVHSNVIVNIVEELPIFDIIFFQDLIFRYLLEGYECINPLEISYVESYLLHFIENIYGMKENLGFNT
jgi:hypothetical protein